VFASQKGRTQHEEKRQRVQENEKCGYNEGKMYRANMFLLFHIIKKCLRMIFVTETIILRQSAKVNFTSGGYQSLEMRCEEKALMIYGNIVKAEGEEFRENCLNFSLRKDIGM
jgi:hypothetical protein